jgi:orotate phosphoribosyltransferase
MTEQEVMQIFYDSGAMLKGHFLLTSGRHSDVYFEKFTILRQPLYVDKLCRLMAQKFKDDGVQLVVGPTIGGIIIAYEAAKHLGVDAIYAESSDDGKARVFKRGFSIEPGTRVLIVDDILTTGRSIYEVIDLCKSYQAEIVGLGLLLDRSGGTVKFNYPLKALATVAAESWEPDKCPLCASKSPITQRGSRKQLA